MKNVPKTKIGAFLILVLFCGIAGFSNIPDSMALGNTKIAQGSAYWSGDWWPTFHHDSIAEASAIAAAMLMGRPGVTAVGYYEKATEIHVSIESEEYRVSMPLSIDGYPTNVSVDGRIYAYSDLP